MVSPPDWLSQFVNAVTGNIHAHDLLSPLGCHFHEVKGVWEVTVFASRTEIIGGSEDGRLQHSSFNVNVAQLLTLFTKVDAVEWQSQPLGQFDELGAHLSIEGVHLTHRIWLRITATAPERFEAGRRADVNLREFEEIW